MPILPTTPDISPVFNSKRADHRPRLSDGLPMQQERSILAKVFHHVYCHTLLGRTLRPAPAGPNPGRIRHLVEQLSEFIGGHSKVESNLVQQTSANLFVSMAGNHCEAAVGVFEYEMAPVDSFQPEPELGKGFDYFPDLRRTKRQLPYSLG